MELGGKLDVLGKVWMHAYLDLPIWLSKNDLDLDNKVENRK